MGRPIAGTGRRSRSRWSFLGVSGSPEAIMISVILFVVVLRGDVGSIYLALGFRVDFPHGACAGEVL